MTRRLQETTCPERLNPIKLPYPPAMVPDLIPMRQVDYLETIGHYRDGQFLAFVVAGIQGQPSGDDWKSRKRWYAVLHRFDHDGNHTNSDIWFAGSTADGENAVIKRAAERCDEWLADLPDRQFGDVAIKTFAVTVDDIVFGLIDETDDEEAGGYVELYPSELGFSEPWDGHYES